MQEPQFVRNLFSSIATRYDFANHLLSGGMDFLWRARAARIVRDWKPARILDLATGSGDLALALAKACPGAEIIGADFCLPMLKQAKAKGLVRLVVADGMRLPFEDGTFDAVTIAFGLRNMESWPGALREMSRVLKTGGHALVLDFSIPENRALGAVYRVYLHRILPRVAGWVTREKSAYDYMADSIEKFPRGSEMVSLMNANGFCEAVCEPLTCGVVSLYTGRKAN
ncbi:MAG TPA: ubiquinone/menaquinone biosynthesis methyltransferase [Chthoniobacteraceae bacterium]|nr:ubiquinone/menaquinone biosynthesis methyltransferase [Chthoniobacteraceae bacterium]